MPLPLASALLALAPVHDITGVYEVHDPPADVFVVLHERAEGEIIGYIAGSPMTWIESGQRYGSGVLLKLKGKDGGSEKPWSITLRVQELGRNLEGVVLQEKDVVPITLYHSTARFVEEPWIWFDEASEEDHDVSRVLDLGGNFLLGGFSSKNSCSFMACGGKIDSWTEITGSHDIWTSSTGGCGQTSHLVGTFDTMANQLNGTWDTTDCTSATYNGSFIAGKVGSTYDKHIQALLLSIGDFADDFEAESLDAADVFHSAYMSDGSTRADWEAQLAAWYAAYDQIEVEISGPSKIVTVTGPDVHPYLLEHPRIAWAVRAEGLNVSTGAHETFWDREEPNILGPDLRFLGVQDGRIVFIGNGETQPLEIGLPIQLADTAFNAYGAWPFGLHGGGHPEDGHSGIDIEYKLGPLVYVYAAADGEITDISPDTSHPPTIIWSVDQRIRPGVSVRYGEIMDPLQVSVGDVITTGTPIGSPMTWGEGSAYAMIHFSLSISEEQTCPAAWWSASAQADWDVIWPQCHYSEELCEPLACNDRDAPPPYTATWNLELAGTNPGPDSILFFRADGHAHDHVYTFFDSAGAVYETGTTLWTSSPSTLGLIFIADGSGVMTYGAIDVVSDEMEFKLDTSMPTDMTGSAVYRYQQ